MHCSISIAACIPRARTQTLGQAFSIALQHFHCSLHPARPNTNHSSALKKRTGFALQEIACIATAQPGPRRCNLRLGCIADIPAALQRRNAPETWLTSCVALADLTEALVQCKVIFCNIHTSWLQGLVSVARGPAALGWPQAACLLLDVIVFRSHVGEPCDGRFWACDSSSPAPSLLLLSGSRIASHDAPRPFFQPVVSNYAFTTPAAHSTSSHFGSKPCMRLPVALALAGCRLPLPAVACQMQDWGPWSLQDWSFEVHLLCKSNMRLLRYVHHLSPRTSRCARHIYVMRIDPAAVSYCWEGALFLYCSRTSFASSTCGS